VIVGVLVLVCQLRVAVSGEILGRGTPVPGDVKLLGVFDIVAFAGLTHPAADELIQLLEVRAELAAATACR
jgi:hypothetical protein